MEFSIGFARYVDIFGVANISSFHAGNCKNKLLVLGDGPTYDINGSFGTAVQNFNTDFIIAKTKFCLSLSCNDDNSYLLVDGEEIYKFKTDNGIVNFPTQFCLGII